MGCDAPRGDFARIPEFERCETPNLPEDGGVSIDGELFIGDHPVIPHGINSYPLLQHVGDENVPAIDDIFQQAISLGRPIVRTNAFMDGGDNLARLRDDDGSLREEGLEALDTVLARAREAGVSLVLVLANNWDDYGGAPAVVEMVAPGEGLPKDAFWSEPRALQAQREYVQAIVSRQNGITGIDYRTDPAVLGWELVNEARCEDPDWCDDETLPQWAWEMSSAIRDAGASQPIFWGGAGYVGDHGEDLEAIGLEGGVDVLTVHLYLEHTHGYLRLLPEAERIEGAVQAGAVILEERIDIADAVGMPLVVEELGWKPVSSGDPDGERAAIYEGWLSVAHFEGIATMPWMIGEEGREDYDGLLITEEWEKTWGVISCEDVTR